MTRTPAPGGEIAGYRLESLLARGGMGVVYLAEETALGRRVALKLLPPELAADEGFRTRFLREMRLAASLEHPHVLPVYAAGESGGQLFLALRYVAGEDLARLLEREGALPPERALVLLAQLASALDAAHAEGLLHRDVKPANVLLAGDHAYLSDFGLARRVEAEGTAVELTGTSAYLAPEVIQGSPPTPASDRYAFACLSYECLTGRPPFERDMEAALLYAHLRDPPPRLPEPMRAADAAFERGLAKAPDRRFGSCAELVEALRAALAPRPAVPSGPAPGLPSAPTPLVGRERELEEAGALVAQRDVRLLTLTGPGGIGKTRLALALAERLAPGYRDGARFVGLAAVSDPELVLPAIAAELEVAEEAGRSLAPVLHDALARRQLLLVLDNLEQLLGAAPVLAGLLGACPGVTILATSRAPLRIQAEQEYEVAPLVEDEAVALFLARARATVASLNDGAAAAHEVVRRLDRLPLALELAAARVRLLGVEGLRSRLEQALPLLTGGPRDAPERQQTLHATIAWSERLLPEDARGAFARLGVFAGGFSLEAAEQVCGAGLETLDALVEHALVRRADGDGDGGARFTQLHVIREYALGRLEESDEADAVRRRHALWVVELLEEIEPELRKGRSASLLERIEPEHANVRAALDWAGAAGAFDLELRIVAAVWWFWYVRGHHREARMRVESALARPQRGDPLHRAKAVVAAATLAWQRGEFDLAGDLATEALALAREAGDDRETGRALVVLGSSAVFHEQWEEADRHLREAADVFARIGDPLREAVALHNLGDMYVRTGDIDSAGDLFEQAAAIHRAHGDRAELAVNLHSLATVSVLAGRPRDALAPAAEGLRIATEFRYRMFTAYCLEVISAALAELGDDATATRLLGAAEALRSEIGFVLQDVEKALHERTADVLRERLGADPMDRLWREGASLGEEEAVSLALEAVASA